MFRGWGAPSRPRVVHKDVDASCFRYGVPRQPFDVLGLLAIGGDPVGSDGHRAQVLLGLLKFFGFSRRKNDVGALFTQSLGHLQTESTRTAGDEGGLAAQVECLFDASHMISDSSAMPACAIPLPQEVGVIFKTSGLPSMYWPSCRPSER